MNIQPGEVEVVIKAQKDGETLYIRVIATEREFLLRAFNWVADQVLKTGKVELQDGMLPWNFYQGFFSRKQYEGACLEPCVWEPSPCVKVAIDKHSQRRWIALDIRNIGWIFGFREGESFTLPPVPKDYFRVDPDGTIRDQDNRATFLVSDAAWPWPIRLPAFFCAYGRIQFLLSGDQKSLVTGLKKSPHPYRHMGALLEEELSTLVDLLYTSFICELEGQNKITGGGQ